MLQTSCTFEVDWSDCDPATIVYNPNFYDWMERGVNALLDAAGYGVRTVMSTDPDFRGVPLVSASATFHAPARYGDTLVRHSAITRLGKSSLDFEHRFYLDGKLIVEATQTRVWSAVDPDDRDKIRSLPIPQAARSALEAERKVEIKTVREG